MFLDIQKQCNAMKLSHEEIVDERIALKRIKKNIIEDKRRKKKRIEDKEIRLH